MGFDQNQPGPIIQPAKKATQVNIWLAVAVVVFFLAGGLGIIWFHHHPREVSHSVNQQIKQETPP